ncbi:MAG TPA: hypothetical protein VK714_08570 [Myxococcota bacterium]|nr:hypothetical protein [Myxococcota bacterium]
MAEARGAVWLPSGLKVDPLPEHAMRAASAEVGEMVRYRHALVTILIGFALQSCAFARQGAWTNAQDAFAAGDYHGAIQKAD